MIFRGRPFNWQQILKHIYVKMREIPCWKTINIKCKFSLNWSGDYLQSKSKSQWSFCECFHVALKNSSNNSMSYRIIFPQNIVVLHNSIIYLKTKRAKNIPGTINKNKIFFFFRFQAYIKLYSLSSMLVYRDRQID